MRNKNTPLRSLLPMYFAARHDLAAKTVRDYTDHFNQFDRFCEQRGGSKAHAATLSDLTLEPVEAYVAFRMRCGTRPGSRGSDHQAAKGAIALKSLASLLADRATWHDGFRRSVLAPLRIPQSDAARKRLSTEEFARVLAAVEQSPFPARDRAVICLLGGNGPREGELAKSRLQDYDRIAAMITIPARSTKGRKGSRKSRVLELDGIVRVELERYLDEFRVGADDPEAALITTRHGSAFTANGIYQILKRLKKTSGVPHLCPHALRHYWTEHFDGDLLELMRAGGWNSLAMVNQYRGPGLRSRPRTSTLASALALGSKRRSPPQREGLHALPSPRGMRAI